MRAARAPITRASEVPYETLCQFLYQEARLLDQRKFDQWNDLFAEGGMYWIPLEEDQEDPTHYHMIIYSGAGRLHMTTFGWGRRTRAHLRF